MSRYIDADKMIEDTIAMKQVADGITIDGIVKYIKEHATTEVMSPEEFAKRTRECANSFDIEDGHRDADKLMCELLKSLGYGEGVENFNDMGKWYS